MADYNLSAHFGATDDISPALSQIIAGLQAVSAATATFQQATGQAGQASAQGFAAAGQAAQQMGQQAQAAGQATAGATGGIGQMGQAAAGASVQIGSLNVTLTQSHQAASQAQSMYLSLGAALNQLPGPLGNLASGFAMLHGRISETNAGLLAATTTIGVLSASLAGGLGQAIEAGMQFQRTFAEVQIVTQATAEQMKQLQDAAIQIGASTQYNAQQAAQGLYELGSAGFTASESIKALTPITTAAMLGNRSLGDTTKEVVAGLRQFGMSATDTTHLVDVMTTAVQGSVVHWNEIGGLWDNLRGRMGQLRIPLEDVVAAEMLMTNSGMSAAQASTAIGTAVDRLSKQTRETAQGLKELGLNVFDASGQFVGLLNIYQQLDARLPSMTVAQQAHAMAMLGGSRAAGAFLNILQQQQRVMKDGNEITLQGVDLFNYWAETLRNSDGATERAANIMRDTLDNQLKVLNGSIGEVAIRIGTQFLPALSAIVPQMTDTLNMFVKADPAIHAMTAGAGAAAVAFGTLTTVMGAWSAMMNTSFGPALIAARGALVAFIPQLLLVAAASAALALAWEQDWGNIREHTR
jgi:TP901 family phage tail tape measure protein